MRVLICACGTNLGTPTVKTKGLCPFCTRSIWMQVARRYKPKSEAIAQGLNRRRQTLCVHDHSPCYSRCGVEMGAAGWQPVNEERRQQWFDKVIHRLTDKKCDHKFVDSNVCLKCGWKAMSEPIPLSAFFTRLGIRARVMEFHEAMGVPILHRPQVPDDDRVRLRLNLIAEEFFETLAAALGESHVHYAKTLVMAAIKYVPINVNLPEFIDGLCDLDYVNEGTRLEFGVNGIPVLDEVHAANMRKIDGPIREDGKRMKPPGWTPPDIERVLVEQGWRK